MIAYRFTRDELWRRINAVEPSWRDRAKFRTDEIVAAGHFVPAPRQSRELWGKIKSVFMVLQHNKCAYCERQLEGLPYGPIEHDVEHYRPKRAVHLWTPPKPSEYEFPLGDALPGGYFRLAFHPANYATACKVCNSILKKSYFPIAEQRITHGEHPEEYAAEVPLLPFPLGDTDADDPEDLIRFEGIIAVPVHKTGLKNTRARVTIDLFKLNGRDKLEDERSQILQHIHFAYQLQERLPDEVEGALQTITSANSPHASCARCFVHLYRTNPERAQEIGRELSRLKQPR